MTTRRHPLPWNMHNGWVHLTSQHRYLDEADERPYVLGLGRNGGVLASLNADELRQLRDQIDLTLESGYRILLLQANLDDTARAEVDRYVRRMAAGRPVEIAVTDAHPPVDALVVDLDADLLRYPTVADMAADGGNLAVVVAGPDGPDMAALAHEAQIAVGLIRVAA